MQQTSSQTSETKTRRTVLASGVGLGVWVVLGTSAFAASDDLAAAISSFAGGAAVREGKVKFEIAELVDNGNVVPITVTVDSPMTASNYVRAIAVFNQKNPQRDVVKFNLDAGAGKASVTTRIRLATTQKLVAVAQLSDGSFWSHSVDVIVTLAACSEGEA